MFQDGVLQHQPQRLPNQCNTLSTAATSSTYRCSPELGFLPMSWSCRVAANRSSSLAGTPQPGQATVPSLTNEQAGGCEQANKQQPLLGVFSCKVKKSMTLTSLEETTTPRLAARKHAGYHCLQHGRGTCDKYNKPLTAPLVPWPSWSRCVKRDATLQLMFTGRRATACLFT